MVVAEQSANLLAGLLLRNAGQALGWKLMGSEGLQVRITFLVCLEVADAFQVVATLRASSESA